MTKTSLLSSFVSQKAMTVAKFIRSNQTKPPVVHCTVKHEQTEPAGTVVVEVQLMGERTQTHTIFFSIPLCPID
jgi:hypothetical protein